MTSSETEPLVTSEEYDENESLGVELEQDRDELEVFEDIQRPWDPESIRVTTKTFSLRNILDLINEDSLELAPDFQRLQVWKIKQKAQLIESLLLQIPLPAFYFAEDADGYMRVVDGLQRLSTVHDFVCGGSDNMGGFRLKELEYIADVQGKRFGDLPAPWQRRIFNTQIVVHVIDPATPAPVKYDIFRRINTGGTPLNGQEIRHCMSKSRSRDFLRRCIGAPEFHEATHGALDKQKRMIDREVALRFVAFRLLRSIEEYRDFGTMETLLLRTTEKLDDPDALSDDDLDRLYSEFLHGLRLSEAIFGRHAFRKWTLWTDTLSLFNRALFESWTCTLCSYDPERVIASREEICQAAREKMGADFDYINSITVSTGSYRRVEKRFNTAIQLLDSLVT